MTMKKTACLKICKKQAPPNGGPVEPQEERPFVATPQEEHPPPGMTMPSPEEAALTSKNYRLAKALIEIRIRQREECENTTRLMMENTNLATRCLEALSHVPILKKELAMQRRATEALLLQREQTQRMASNLSAEMSRLGLSGSEDTGENIWAANPPPPSPLPSKKATIEPVVVEQQAAIGPKSEFVSDLDENDTVAETIEEADELDTVAEMISPTNEGRPSQPKAISTPKKSSEGKGITLKVHSTPNRHRIPGFTPKFGAPIYASNWERKGSFPPSASPKVVSSSRPNSCNEDFPPDLIPQSQRVHQFANNVSEQDDQTSGSSSTGPSSSSSSSSSSESQSLEPRSGIIGMNSIESFEASFDSIIGIIIGMNGIDAAVEEFFDTTFPEAVTPKESEASERKELKTGTPKSCKSFNPFAMSPAPPAEKTDGRSERSPLPGTQSSASNPGNSVVIREANASYASIFGIPNTLEQKKTADYPWNEEIEYHTPASIASEESKRPEKTVSEDSSRAGNENALQSRSSSTSSSITSSSTSSSSTTHQEEKRAPSLTLEPSLSTRRLNALKKSRSVLALCFRPPLVLQDTLDVPSTHSNKQMLLIN